MACVIRRSHLPSPSLWGWSDHPHFPTEDGRGGQHHQGLSYPSKGEATWRPSFCLLQDLSTQGPPQRFPERSLPSLVAGWCHHLCLCAEVRLKHFYTALSYLQRKKNSIVRAAYLLSKQMLTSIFQSTLAAATQPPGVHVATPATEGHLAEPTMDHWQVTLHGL